MYEEAAHWSRQWVLKSSIDTYVLTIAVCRDAIPEALLVLLQVPSHRNTLLNSATGVDVIVSQAPIELGARFSERI